ncbi:hypothetical protein HMPREF1013_00865 [Bacillus sp. 2_A_57_CT2]|nr:hypothetical protein HMPREF1013_00865 [Bacillus sp. 2_A_57_CT2]
MEVKTLKNLNQTTCGQIKKGEVFKVRKLGVPSLINPNAWVYQIVEGKHSGSRLAPEFCLEIGNIKTFTEQEWNEMENHYMDALDKERQEKERAQEMVHKLTEQINNKNKDIEKLTFFVECSNLALRASCQAIETLKGNR